jgi:hypothetical protein
MSEIFTFTLKSYSIMFIREAKKLIIIIIIIFILSK